MEVKHDPEADAIYILLRDVPYAFGQNLDADRRIDYGADELPMGIELLSVSHGVWVDDLPKRPEVAALLAQHNIKVFDSSHT